MTLLCIVYGVKIELEVCYCASLRSSFTSASYCLLLLSLLLLLLLLLMEIVVNNYDYVI